MIRKWPASFAAVSALSVAAVPAIAASKGDVNRDGFVNGRDVQPFVAALLAPAGPNVLCEADANEDRALTLADIPPFVDLLLGRTPAFYATRGHWDCPFDWGLPGNWTTPIHVAVLPTRAADNQIVAQVFSFGYYANHNHYLWDPATGQFSLNFFDPGMATRNCVPALPPGEGTLFCAGHSALADGRLLITGGDLMAADLDCPNGFAFAGPRFAFLFDPLAPPASRWTGTPLMNRGRWYPTNTTLPNGRVMVNSGFDDCSRCDPDGDPITIVNPDVEVYDPASGSPWTIVSQREFPLYPWMYVLSTGHVLYAGPGTDTRRAAAPGYATWPQIATAAFPFRGAGTSVLLPGRLDSVLNIGGACCDNPATATTELLDLSNGLPAAWQTGPTLNVARCHLDAVLLPDGAVLVVGGRLDSDFGAGPAVPVYSAELLRPAPAPFAWQPMSSHNRPRMYHSTAVLLPDGRVLALGGTAFPGFPNDERNAELYSPPYLYAGSRPRLMSAPATIAYGASFGVTTPAPTQIDRVAIVRLSAVTHSFNQDQRHLFLNFQLSAIPEGLTVTAPASGNLAPPGYYMLFLVSTQGVPSEARLVRLG